jgi:hypothetical protein
MCKRSITNGLIGESIVLFYIYMKTLNFLKEKKTVFCQPYIFLQLGKSKVHHIFVLLHNLYNLSQIKQQGMSKVAVPVVV